VGSGSVRGSLEAGRLVVLDGCAPTDMVGLRCAAVSPTAWPALQATVDAAVGVTESDVHHALTAYSQPINGDARIASAASGAAGLAALLALLRRPAVAPLRDGLELSSRSRVLVINTEGATDHS
jgi:diaminopropionate ammonia-lyase